MESVSFLCSANHRILRGVSRDKHTWCKCLYLVWRFPGKKMEGQHDEEASGLIPLSEEEEEKFCLIVGGGLKEVLGANQLRWLLKERKEIKILWSLSITEKIHLAHFLPVYKIADFLAGILIFSLFEFIYYFIIFLFIYLFMYLFKSGLPCHCAIF